MIDIKAATYQWLILLMLTCLSFALAESGFSGRTFILPVLLATFAKGCIVIDRYMALRYVAGFWRLTILAWLLLVLGLIWFSFTRV
ncbi:MAG: cytochrome C oxidase subunit IV family protein [Undibacterium sp.]|uniref:cytochrome C oxidase subunit IV family protein n=1 Tax=Undibacterium sp. TaxID=1914977 RepID=UPI00271FE3E3|nr:cytochrome C oxidase subunit IV family protein [Undibacterium sp.]MDO8651559.1 cytochrome C oxidase subunit IV family protein [Undibacterium sp.]